MQRPLMLAAFGAVAALGAAAAGGALWYERPTRLTVAVSQNDEPDRALIDSAARLLKRSHNPARLQIQLVEDAKAASEAVDARRADLAVIRTDVAIPGDAQTVVILHRDSAVLVAPASSGIKTVADLPGHTVGVLRMGAGNLSLLANVLAEADLKPDSVATVQLKPDEIEAALRSHRISAVMAVDVLSNSALRAIVRTVSTIDPPPAAAPPPPAPAKAGAKPAAKPAKGKAPPAAKPARIAKADKGDDEEEDDEAEPAKGTVVFLPISEAEAIASRSPAYEKTEVLRGIFGGTPPRPGKDYDTLSITHRLVANENVSQDLVAGLTRFFLTEKGPIAATAPIAMRIEAPSTDKGASLPVHAGSAAYIDDDEQTFFDKYSDMIYIGAMLLGVLASGVTAVMGRLSGTRTPQLELDVARLIALMGEARAAASSEELDALQGEADQLMARALDGSLPRVDDRRLAAFGMALDQVRAAVRDRRAQIGLAPKPAEIVVMPLAAE
ncbi:ABC transporter substrate-binding protein [Lichenibacterium dinghuense]|uniref:ABC transporter substrate-binding protein n=1 Tax=Lichenibacterium dinghuense TaxID=2895977 RepID=UPI001F3B76FE|nr:ABC transporter substrate-binding protein [Lichenibacterium sp. 6Y81]